VCKYQPGAHSQEIVSLFNNHYSGLYYFSSSLCVQISSEAHPASYPMGIGGPFPGSKARPGRDADHTPPSSARSRMRSYSLSPPLHPHGVYGTALLSYIGQRTTQTIEVRLLYFN
jgi:hypothetical protein